MNNQSQQKLMIQKFIDDLQSRNLIYDCTNKEKLIENLLNNKKIYLGIDPTAPSLHLGNFLALSILKRAEIYDIKTVVVLGQLTALIGDPSFKTQGRKILDDQAIKKNSINIQKQIQKLCPQAEILNNLDFYASLSIIDVLREIGTKLNVSYLLAKDFLKDRLKTGLTVTEFLYPLFQSYDFYYLFKNHDVFIQTGGSDQWGNITSGIEFIKKNCNEEINPSAFTFPLLTDDNGNKFGKSENNALFLDEQLTKPYEIHQYLINQSDEMTIKYLKYLTFLDLSEIEIIHQKHLKTLKHKLAQKNLSFCLLKYIHSEEIAQKISLISSKLFDNNYDLSEEDFKNVEFAIPTQHIESIDKNSISQILINLGFSTSISESRRLINSKCIYCFSKLIEDPKYIFIQENSKFNYFLIKKGKKEYGLIYLKI